MKHGRFIALEGGEGTGKSTQARLLCDNLRKRGLDVELTREPGGTDGAEAIRNLLLHPSGEGWNSETEALLFAAARADHVAKRILPALKAGRWVVCDRFLDSSRAYQGVAGGMGDDTINALHIIGSGNLLPDITVIIHASDAVVTKRLRARDGETSDAIGGRGDAYHNTVNAAFLRFTESEPDRFRLVNGSGSIDDVQMRIMDAVSTIFPEISK